MRLPDIDVSSDMADLAVAIADRMLAELKAGQIAKLGIEEIQAAMTACEEIKSYDRFRRQQLENLILRRLVYSVA